MKAIIHSEKDSYIEKKTKEARRKGIEQASQFICECLALVLFDKWNFNDSDVVDLLNQLSYTVDSVVSGYIDIEDIRKTLKDDYDFQVVPKGGKI